MTYTDSDLWALIKQDAKPSIEQPEALTLLWQSERLGVPVYDGPIRQWPWILLREITVTMNAIAAHDKLIADNAAKKIAFIEQQQKQQG